MKQNQAIRIKAAAASFHLRSALGKINAFANTRLGDEIISDLKAARGHLLEIDGSIDYLEKA